MFDGEIKQGKRVFAGSLNDNGNLALVRRAQRRTHTLKVARLGLLALAHYKMTRHLNHARAALSLAATPALRLLRHHANPTPRCG